MLFGGSAALHFAQRGHRREHDSPVNGASGAIGTNAVQIAKHLDATVTAVTSGSNAALVTDLGADDVIDYTSVDLAATKRRFDVVLDTVGNLDPASAARLLTDSGTAVLLPRPSPKTSSRAGA